LTVHINGKTKLGFFPLPVLEAKRLRNYLAFSPQFSAVDPCVGDGVAFSALVEGAPARRCGIEIDAFRATQARALGIDVLQANTMDVRCNAESFSLVYLNPPYDWESGQASNQRLESVFLEHTYRWLKPEGILVFVIPQPRLKPCARLLADHFKEIRVYRLTEAECVQYKQIALLAIRRKRHERPRDAALIEATEYFEQLAIGRELPPLTDMSEAIYRVPESGPTVLSNTGIPLDDVEDLVLQSAAYRQASRILLHERSDVRGRPLTPLHGGHVGLLCTAGLLNGVFGEGDELHIAHWRSVKFVDHWEEEEGETRILHDRERFSHELTLIFVNGETSILTHEKAKPS
jgi:SAM-dependent methyltransferase